MPQGGYRFFIKTKAIQRLPQPNFDLMKNEYIYIHPHATIQYKCMQVVSAVHNGHTFSLPHIK
jgi:hypothetical protein